MHPSAYTRESGEYRFVREHLQDDVHKLALQVSGFNDMDYQFAIRQISGYQRIIHKIPDWYACPDLVFPQSLSLEQCSSQRTAIYKKEMMESVFEKLRTQSAGFNRTIGVDLTGGFGVDAFWLSQNLDQFIYVEKQDDLCRIAEHNFKALACSNIQVIKASAEDYLKQTGKLDFIYVDPSRRDAGGSKKVALKDCSPDLTSMLDLLLQKARVILLKLSPMIDLSLALKALPPTRQISVVSVDNECKEVLFLLTEKLPDAEPEILSINLRTRAADQVYTFRRTQEFEAECIYSSEVERYLYEPNTSIMKAGAFCGPAERFGLRKCHINSHLYVSNEYQASFPGKIFEVQSVLPARPKEFRKKMPELFQANLVLRNFPSTVEILRRKFSLKEGGEDYIFATTMANESKVLIFCKRLV